MPPRLCYALFMLLALSVFLWVRQKLPKPPALRALPWRKRLALGLAAFIGGTFGAKLPFVLGATGALGATAWLSDGKTIVAGLAGAYLGVELAKWWLGVRVKTGDTFALPLALAMAVGRWGCFFNGCCYGVETSLPWGVWFSVDGRMLCCHPTQVYESLFHLIMAGVLWLLMRRDWLPRQRLKFYLIAYCCYRFVTEFIRPEPVWLGGLTFYQWAALALALALAVQWWFDSNPATTELAPAPC
jgi:prolipoprotein diacylglyceryltransferase